MLPELNLRSMQLLNGLCYRCLAGDSDPASAPLTNRRLEQLRLENTELSLRQSAARADLAIAKDKAGAAEATAEQTAVDLKLFEEANPPPPDRKTFFGMRPGREDKAVAAERREITRLLELANDDARTAGAKVEALQKELAGIDGRLATLRNEQGRLADELRGQFSALVLGHCAAGEWDRAAGRIRELRETLRGDLSVAVLGVVLNLLRDGVEAARGAILESRTVFESNPPQARKVLESLLSYAAGNRMDRSELGLVLPGQLDWQGLFALYQCVVALSGWKPETEGLGLLQSQTVKVLWSLAHRGEDEPDSEQAQTDDQDVPDVLCMAIQSHLALQQDKPEQVLELSGVTDWIEQQPANGEKPARLDMYICDMPFPAWPEALREPWQALLCCQVLLAGRGRVSDEVHAAWVEESYGWPKGDFFWWTLAQVKADPALERNISGNSQMIVLPARI